MGIWDWGYDLAKELWITITDSLKSGMSGLSGLASWVQDWAKGVIKGLSGFIGKAWEGVKNIGKEPKPMNDFIVTPAGTIQTNPKDYIIGTKDPRSLGGGGKHITNNISINVTGFIDDDLIPVLVNAISDQMDRVGGR